MAIDEVTHRLQRICEAFGRAGVRYALVGGQAVALWVAQKDPGAVRTTKGVDVLLHRDDLPQARAAAREAGLDYFEVLGVGMFLERDDPSPRKAVHLVWSGERVRPEYEFPSPTVERRTELAPRIQVIDVPGLVRMKLISNRDQDRVHLRDMIEVGLIDRPMLESLPLALQARLEPLLTEAGR